MAYKDKKDQIKKLKEWRKNNPDKVKAQAKRYREKYGPILNKKKRENYKKDPERYKKSNNKWMKRNKEYMKVYNKNKRIENLEENRRKAREYAKTPEQRKKRSENQKKHSKKRSIQEIFRSTKWISKKHGREFNLTFDYLENMPLICYYTGIKLTLRRGKYNSVSLDRVNSKKGYIKGNVVFCCQMVNFMKQEYSKTKFINMCKLIASRNK